MANRKYTELAELSDLDLQARLDEQNVQYQQLRFDHSIKGLDNPLQLRATRKDIARLKTEIRRREVNSMTPEQVARRSKIRSRRRKA
jgi:large subunit ribosomal protein L29